MSAPDPSPAARWALAVAWAGLIFLASTSLFSGEHTASVLAPLLAWLLPHADPTTLAVAHAALRKLAHFVEYLVLGVLLARALCAGEPWSARAAVQAVAIAALYALTDELHQHFVPGRTAALGDVLVDTAGAAAGQIAIGVRRLVAPK